MPLMKYLAFYVSIVLFISCSPSPDKPVESELFGRGIISNELPEFATSVNADETEIFFNRTTADRSSMQIMVSSLVDDVWSEPEALPFSTGEFLDVDPFLTADGSRLYFSSTRPREKGGGEEPELDTWYIERNGDSWSDPINPGSPLNSDSTEIFVSMANNGNAYFVSESDGTRGIKVSHFINEAYQPMEPIVLKLNGEVVYASNPAIAFDESFIIVASRGPDSSEDVDLYVSWNKDGTWSELVNLGPLVNTTYAEFAPGISKDGKTLYFTSERPGIVQEVEEGVRPPGDIYKVNLQAVLDSISQ